MSQGKFSIVFLSKYNTKNLVRMLLLLSKFSPSDLGLDVGHALQLSKIMSNFIKRNVSHSFLSSASFLGRDIIIFVSENCYFNCLKHYLNFRFWI
jgi:hypothetical protein